IYDRAAYGHVVRVLEPTAETRAPLHEYGVASSNERFHTTGNDRDAIFVRLDLLRDPDNHDSSGVIGNDYDFGPRRSRTCRSGSKNSAARAATSSSVTASIRAMSWSSVKYGSS